MNDYDIKYKNIIEKAINKYSTDEIVGNSIYNIDKRSQIIDVLKTTKLPECEFITIMNDEWLQEISNNKEHCIKTLKKSIWNKMRNTETDFLLFIEYAIIKRDNKRFVSPHVHGYVWTQSIDSIRSKFNTVGQGVRVQNIYDTDRLKDYMIKHPKYLTSYYVDKKGNNNKRIMGMNLIQHYKIYKKLKNIKYQDLIICGGEEGTKIGRGIKKRISKL